MTTPNRSRRQSNMRGNVDAVRRMMLQLHGELVPKDIKVLLHLSEVISSESPGPVTALCLQYPVHAKAEKVEDAVRLVLANFVDYLELCISHECFPMSRADDVFQIAFEHGDELDASSFLDARVSERLRSFISEDVDKRLIFRDVSQLQLTKYSEMNRVHVGEMIADPSTSLQRIFGGFAA